ncbi:prepilin-type N-terminal cleavage/methylation domain-containing protein, partial [Salmonella enterica]
MPTNIPSWLGIGRRGRCRGFSLVELSMVVIVLGIIV